VPSTEQILAGLTRVANAWWLLAATWHLYFAIFTGLLIGGNRPSRKLAGVLMSLPVLSVSLVAWASGNPFNGIVLALLTVLLIVFSVRLPGRVRIAPLGFLIPGIALTAFGWVYPHFVETASPFGYLYKAPIGIVPCATLSILIGLTLVLNGLDSRAFALSLGISGLFYGVTGIGRFRVGIDVVLLLGAILLTIRAFRRRRAPEQSATEQVPGRITAFGIGPRLALSMLPYSGLALGIHIGLPHISRMTEKSSPVLFVAGAALIAGGILLWALGERVVIRAFRAGRLQTSGIYALVRHPMYSSALVFVIPGVALLLRSWPILSVAAGAYLAFRFLVRREERYLQEKFGQEFTDYRARVNAVVPLPRFVVGPHRKADAGSGSG
jgi:protein-S-isoprenylcysteine O-methyltransferase Ste14